MIRTVDERIMDQAIDAYVLWREHCVAVEEAYAAWAHAPRADAGAAFLRYAAALEHEDRASCEYAGLVRCLAAEAAERIARTALDYN
jgi:hypothetical protein